MVTPMLGARARRFVRSVGVLIGGVVLVMVAISAPPRPASATVNEHCGVDQLRIHRTANGQLLDLRYRVVDPQLATTLLAKDNTAYAVHEQSGTRLRVPSTPKAGSLRTKGSPRAGRSYFALFTNPGGLVRRGDQVSVVLGDLTAELTVE